MQLSESSRLRALELLVLNRCFDDIEQFVCQIQAAVLEFRALKSKHTKELKERQKENGEWVSEITYKYGAFIEIRPVEKTLKVHRRPT